MTFRCPCGWLLKLFRRWEMMQSAINMIGTCDPKLLCLVSTSTRARRLLTVNPTCHPPSCRLATMTSNNKFKSCTPLCMPGVCLVHLGLCSVHLGCINYRAACVLDVKLSEAEKPLVSQRVNCCRGGWRIWVKGKHLPETARQMLVSCN